MGKRKIHEESCSIDITDATPTATDEIIDLAGDSPTTSGTVVIKLSFSDAAMLHSLLKDCR